MTKKLVLRHVESRRSTHTIHLFHRTSFVRYCNALRFAFLSFDFFLFCFILFWMDANERRAVWVSQNGHIKSRKSGYSYTILVLIWKSGKCSVFSQSTDWRRARERERAKNPLSQQQIVTFGQSNTRLQTSGANRTEETEENHLQDDDSR